MVIFADDTTILSTNEDPVQLIKNLQHHINLLKL